MHGNGSSSGSGGSSGRGGIPAAAASTAAACAAGAAAASSGFAAAFGAASDAAATYPNLSSGRKKAMPTLAAICLQQQRQQAGAGRQAGSQNTDVGGPASTAGGSALCPAYPMTLLSELLQAQARDAGWGAPRLRPTRGGAEARGLPGSPV
jgi:hypothetical protein